MQSHATLNCPLNVYKLVGDQILPSNLFPGSKQDGALSGKPFYRPEGSNNISLSFWSFLVLCPTGEKNAMGLFLSLCVL